MLGQSGNKDNVEKFDANSSPNLQSSRQTAPTKDTSEHDSTSNNSVFIYVGIAVGAVAVLGVVGGLTFWINQRERNVDIDMSPLVEEELNAYHELPVTTEE